MKRIRVSSFDVYFTSHQTELLKRKEVHGKSEILNCGLVSVSILMQSFALK